jgi:hypothetical protein
MTSDLVLGSGSGHSEPRLSGTLSDVTRNEKRNMAGKMFCVKCTEWELSILCAYSGGLGVFGGSCFSDI